MRYKHYAPRAEVIVLDGDLAKIAEFLAGKPEYGKLCFDEDKEILGMPNALSYGSAGDSKSQARELFARLRDFDEMPDIKRIYARKPSCDGIGTAVFNRLIRAAGFNLIKI